MFVVVKSLMMGHGPIRLKDLLSDQVMLKLHIIRTDQGENDYLVLNVGFETPQP